MNTIKMLFAFAFANVSELYENDPELKRDDVKIIQENIYKQPHLPPITELQVILFLQSCYYRIEETKTTIDHYFSIKHIFPEIFKNRDPQNSDIQSTLKCVNILNLKKLTPEGYTALLLSLENYNPENFNFQVVIRILDMLETQRLHQHGPQEGLIWIIDMKGSVFGHVVKASNIAFLRKFFYYLQEIMPIRLKSIHWINSKPFLETFLTLIKPFVKKDLWNKIYVHSTKSAETLYEYVPLECLPSDYGGQDDSVAVLRGIEPSYKISIYLY
ncbi:alpha-tocopherol transfer protein-like [Euwallacea similis]|uniref:alpha-tocopherol transfer protein-like n=1 Tax=Euwallacea similis TaxID=1736056 RepID=UPI00344C6F66